MGIKYGPNGLQNVIYKGWWISQKLSAPVMGVGIA